MSITLGNSTVGIISRFYNITAAQAGRGAGQVAVLQEGLKSKFLDIKVSGRMLLCGMSDSQTEREVPVQDINPMSLKILHQSLKMYEMMVGSGEIYETPEEERNSVDEALMGKKAVTDNLDLTDYQEKRKSFLTETEIIRLPDNYVLDTDELGSENPVIQRYEDLGPSD